ncbi:MAG TPA: RDD family protein [Candidatus Dormibacteraeota bacterium]|nr:RDD family protein [Candidatus Dormibacteraeota bacterium]
MTSEPLPVARYRSPFAGLRVRLLGLGLDLCLVWLVAAVVAVVTGTRLDSARGLLLDVAGALVYFPVCWGIMGWSLGQHVFGLRVVRAADGNPIGPGAAAMRAVGCAIAALPLFVGVLWSGWDSRKQGWQDKFAGTVVIHDR